MESIKRAKRKFKIAVTVTILLVAGIAATWLGYARGPSPPRVILEVSAGEVEVMVFDAAVQAPSWETRQFRIHWSPWTGCRYAVYPWISTDLLPNGSVSCTHYSIPLWPLLLPPAIIASRAHRTVRRLSRAGCKHCGYSRAGLAANAPCPECGAAA